MTLMRSLGENKSTGLTTVSTAIEVIQRWVFGIEYDIEVKLDLIRLVIMSLVAAPFLNREPDLAELVDACREPSTQRPILFLST